MNLSSGEKSDLKNRIRRFYDDYHQHREREPDDRMKHLYWALFRGRVLEVGGGRRLPSNKLRDMRSYVMVDISMSAVRTAFKAGVAGILAEGESLPFGDRSFDTVACCEVIEHLVDPDFTIREMCRTSLSTVVVMGPNYLDTEWMPGLDRCIPLRLLKYAKGQHRHPCRLEPHLDFDEKWGPDADAVSACNAWWVAHQIRQAGFQVTTLDTWSFFNLSLFNRVPGLRYLGPYQVIVGRRLC